MYSSPEQQESCSYLPFIYFVGMWAALMRSKRSHWGTCIILLQYL